MEVDAEILKTVRFLDKIDKLKAKALQKGFYYSNKYGDAHMEILKGKAIPAAFKVNGKTITDKAIKKEVEKMRFYREFSKIFVGTFGDKYAIGGFLLNEIFEL